jgi:hypothetical protein
LPIGVATMYRAPAGRSCCFKKSNELSSMRFA